LDIPKVAGFSDINVEAILRLRPDLVITPVDKKETQGELERLGLTVMPMDTRSLSGLREAIRDLGYATGHRADADRILGDFDAAVAFARRNALGKPRPRVLFSVMHSYAGLGYISQLTIAGQDGFFSELLEICGGVNAYEGALPFPTLSREAIMKLNPDVIIDLMRDEAEGREAAEGWKSLSNVAAIRDGRLYIFTDEADTVPGPRAYLTIRKIAAAIHPVGGETAALSAEGL
jgi:iron complex transport system substrate-binding protein